MTATTARPTPRTETEMTHAERPHYQAPGWVTRNVMNRLVRRLARMGVSVWGSAELRVRGRSSGEWRTTPVNVLTVDGERYPFAARGEGQWVRNVRVAGGGELRIGRRVETFTVTEVADVDKPAVLRPYLERWAFEVGAFFDGVDASSTDADLAAAGPRHPVFRLREA